MAVVQGVREKVHLPIYDSLTIKGGEQLRDAEPSSTLKFFVNVQGKTKLETNLQSASLLPHYNTFEARALRVVISDLPPDFGDEKVELVGVKVDEDGVVTEESANVNVTLSYLIELIRDEARDLFTVTDEDTEVTAEVTRVELEDKLEALDKKKVPIGVQIEGDDATGIINRLIYNTVTTLYVGEKTMIQMPTWFFPSGAGAYSESGTGATHGVPSPSDTFRFAEPIFIEKQQNFRVEIEVPDSDVLRDLHRIYGPMFIWVVLDGYMTRSVQ